MIAIRLLWLDCHRNTIFNDISLAPDQLPDMPNRCPVPGVAVPLAAAPQPRVGGHPPCVRIGVGPALRLLHVRPAGNAHCRFAGHLLHRDAHPESANGSAVSTNHCHASVNSIHNPLTHADRCCSLRWPICRASTCFGCTTTTAPPPSTSPGR